MEHSCRISPILMQFRAALVFSIFWTNETITLVEKAVVMVWLRHYTLLCVKYHIVCIFNEIFGVRNKTDELDQCSFL
jgi:hypothetical protein